MQPIAEQAGVSLSFLRGRRHALRSWATKTAIRQIVLNIVCNAIRHTDSRRTVSTFRAARVPADGKDRLPWSRFATPAAAFPRTSSSHLFDAGFSATGETPGLGLAVCKRLMTQHGGAIRVTSRVHEGSTFQLEFPAL